MDRFTPGSNPRHHNTTYDTETNDIMSIKPNNDNLRVLTNIK